MDSWIPDQGASRADRTALSAAVRTSTVDVALGALPARAPRVRALLDGLWGEETRGAPGLFHPDFFSWYFALGDAVRADDLAGVVTAFDELEAVVAGVRRSRARARDNEPVLGAPIDFGMEGATAERALLRLRGAAADAARSAGESLQGETRRLIANLDPAVSDSISAALCLIRRVWPAMHEEVLDYVQRLVLVETDDIIGASDASSIGAIFVGAAEARDPVKLAEELIHESSHNVLNTVSFLELPCLNPPEERHGSPLRKDPRPLFGIFHQVFVLARLAHFYSLVLPLHPERRAQHEDIKARLRGGVSVINTHARLTDKGARLMASINELDNHFTNPEVSHA